MALKIDIYMAEICGSYHELSENLERAIAEQRVTADISYHTVYFDDAVTRNIMGSPSIWINGRDAFESANAPGIT